MNETVEKLIHGALKVGAIGLLLLAPLWFFGVASVAGNTGADPWAHWAGYGLVTTVYLGAFLSVRRNGVGTGMSLIVNALLAGVILAFGLMLITRWAQV